MPCGLKKRQLGIHPFDDSLGSRHILLVLGIPSNSTFSCIIGGSDGKVNPLSATVFGRVGLILLATLPSPCE
jgi:hypothetical protein